MRNCQVVQKDSKKKKQIVPVPKHGTHGKRPESNPIPKYAESIDPEDPQWSPESDPTLDIWENENERELRTDDDEPNEP